MSEQPNYSHFNQVVGEVLCGLLFLIGFIAFITQTSSCVKVSSCVDTHSPKECEVYESRILP